jgi:hypothetical protein
MEVTAVVNGLEQVDSVATVDPKVKITPSQTRMRPTIVLDAPAYQPRHDTVRQSVTISVVDEHGTPLKNKTVDLTVMAKENDAGHHHVGNATKPPGSLSLTQVNTGESGSVDVVYQAPEPCGQITITGTSAGAEKDSAIIVIAVDGLISYGPGPGYTLIGGDTHGGAHFDNHYATAQHIAAIQKLAAEYLDSFGTGLEYNDSSLEFGGLFDYDWEANPWHTPHGGHREGNHTDLRTEAEGGSLALTAAQRREISRIWKRELSGSIRQEGTHWHLKLPN